MLPLVSIVLPSLLSLLAFVHGKDYCAIFDPDTSSGASGYFQISINNGVGQYQYYLDLSGIDYPCDPTGGLLYHFHNFWYY